MGTTTTMPEPKQRRLSAMVNTNKILNQSTDIKTSGSGTIGSGMLSVNYITFNGHMPSP
jgi:hypothetical protein